jgi:hypothetical protein
LLYNKHNNNKEIKIMARYDNDNTVLSYTQSGGTIELKTQSYHAPVHQVCFATDSTTGTLAIKARYHPLADVVVVYDEDNITPLVIDLTVPQPFKLEDNWVWSIIFEPTGVDASYKPLITSGEMCDI